MMPNTVSIFADYVRSGKVKFERVPKFLKEAVRLKIEELDKNEQ